MIPGPTELILILIIVIVIFGAKRIPEIMGGMGKGIRSFKKAMDEEETPPAASTQTPPSPVTPGEPGKEKIEPK